jgi:hypothetical protein
MTLLQRQTLIVLCLLACTALISCSSSKDAGNRPPDAIKWNIQFKPNAGPVVSKCPPYDRLLSIWTDTRPSLLPATDQLDERLRITDRCQDGQEVIYEIPRSRIDTILYATSPRDTAIPLTDIGVLEGSCRKRYGLGPFHKLEIRLVAGYRGGNDSVFYPSISGGHEVVSDKFFSADTGGSPLFLGLEIAGYWSFDWLDPTDRLQLGIKTGVWPIDGSIFIPAALSARYTFNQGYGAFTEDDNSWYLYGDLGIPLDFTTKAPIFGDDGAHQRIFYGAGIGRDWALSCDLDFSLDIGVRRFNLPLPPIDCCPDVDASLRNPYRMSTGVYTRFGLTF